MRYLIFILACASAWGQNETAGFVASSITVADLTAAAITRSIKSGASDPATCTLGKDLFINTSSTPVIKLCTATNTWTALGSSSMVYPGAGVAVSTGSAWGSSLTVGTGANNLVQLNGSSQLPAVSAALLTNFPTLNQSTTGSAATLTTPRAIYGNNFDGSAALTQIIASTYGGTGNGFTKFSGPTTSEKTFTLPNASGSVMVINPQSGAPSGACTAGSGWILDTTAQEFYACSVSGTWKRILTTIDSGTSVVGMLEGTAPGAGASAGVHNLYFDSADHKLKSHVNGGSVVTYYSSLNPQTTVSGNAGTATALAANGSNCSAGSFPLGVDASGAAESCTAVTSVNVTAAQMPALTGDVTSSAGAVATTIANGAVTPAKASTSMKRDAIGVAVGDPAGSALATGVLGYVVVPNACTIAGWDIVVDGGTATVDVWKVGTGTAKPTVSNTITASAKPAISTGTVIHSTTLTGWTTSVTAFDIIGFNLDTVATAKYITVQLFCDRQ